MASLEHRIFGRGPQSQRAGGGEAGPERVPVTQRATGAQSPWKPHTVTPWEGRGAGVLIPQLCPSEVRTARNQFSSTLAWPVGGQSYCGNPKARDRQVLAVRQQGRSRYGPRAFGGGGGGGVATTASQGPRGICAPSSSTLPLPSPPWA